MLDIEGRERGGASEEERKFAGRKVREMLGDKQKVIFLEWHVRRDGKRLNREWGRKGWERERERVRSLAAKERDMSWEISEKWEGYFHEQTQRREERE